MATDEQLGLHRVDAAIQGTGLLVRAAVYTFCCAFADAHDCGRALLTGLVVEDVAGSLLALSWEWRNGRLQAAAELVLLGLVFLFVRSWMVWPDDLALRAILGLAAFGVFVAKVGSTLLWQFGQRERGFA